MFAILSVVILAMALCVTAYAAGDADAAGEAAGGGGLIGSFLSGQSLQDIFKTLFITTINYFLSGIVNNAFKLVDRLMLNFLSGVFHAENFVNPGETTVLTLDMLRNIYAFLYAFTCGLVTLKFLFKGFQIYILWRNGDADASPRDMVTGVAEAAVVMVAFPYLYERAVDVCSYLADGIMGRMGMAKELSGGLSGVVTFLAEDAGGLLLTVVFALIFIICVFILWIKLMVQGLELLVMRLGLPLATLGLIDSDMALFKNYMQIFIKTALTVIIQVALMSISFRVIMTFQFLNVFAAIALISTALSTPRLMQQFLAPQGAGGGAMQKAHSAAMVVRTAMMLLK